MSSPQHTHLPATDARRLGFRLHLRGETAEAAAVYDSALLDDADETELALFYAAAASTSWAQGDLETCRSRAALAMAHAERTGDDEALGWAWTAQALLATLDGDPHAEGFAYARASRHAARAQDVVTQVRLFINVSDRLTGMGSYQPAITQLERAFTLLDEHPQPLMEALAHENLGRALLGLGRLDEALEQFEQARHRWLGAGAPQLRTALLGIGDTHLALGNASQAASAYREVIRLSEDGADPHSLVPALAGLARATVVDDPQECDEALDRALDHPVKIAPVAVYLAAGWVALARGMHNVAVAHGREAEREAGRRQDSGGMAEALELLSLAVNPDRRDGRLTEAQMIWLENGDVVRRTTSDIVLARQTGDLCAERAARARLRSLGVHDDTDRVAGPLLVLGTPPKAEVELHTLGAFSVTRQGRRVGDTEWRSPEARTLLQLLAAQLGAGVTVSSAAEALGTDRAGVLAALEDLRAALDPTASHADDHYVRHEGDALALRPRTVALDAVDFRTDAELALACAADSSPRAPALLERAAALHTGRFLDDVEADWAEETREELARLSREVRRTLAAHWTGCPERAVPWLVGLVHEDPTDSGAQLALVRALGAVGRQSEAARYYAEYSQRVRELGGTVEPMPTG